jgi:hypothetical protein
MTEPQQKFQLKAVPTSLLQHQKFFQCRENRCQFHRERTVRDVRLLVRNERVVFIVEQIEHLNQYRTELFLRSL